METYIVILRGINVSGKNKLPMEDLGGMLHKLEFTNVKTYIQSGNIILSSKEDKTTVISRIKTGIQDHFGYDITVIIRTPLEWEKAIQNNPYKEVEPKQQYFTFLSENSKVKNFEIEAKKDEFTIVDNVVYINAVGGYGKTKLTNNLFEKKLKVNATTRNLRTTMKLLELAKEN